MKTPAGNLVRLACWLLPLSPLATVTAQLPAAPLGRMARDLNHLTLLPGPELLSPARGAGAPAPAITRDAPRFYFVPVKLTSSSSASHAPAIARFGSLSLGASPSPGQPPAGLRQPSAPPAPGSLRFDARLPATPAALPLGHPPAVRRD